MEKEPLFTTENEVKTIYPNSVCERDGALFFVRTGKKDLGAGFSKQAAWNSAKATINKCNL